MPRPLPSSQRWTLPPLILHPVSHGAVAGALLNGSRAELELDGVLPGTEVLAAEHDMAMLEGRYAEICMLYYMGKDLTRWIDQCLDSLRRNDSLLGAGLSGESFAGLLVEDPPERVRRKLRAWGVSDFKNIFSRALGLHAVFSRLPQRDEITPDFIRYYCRFADCLFACRQQAVPFVPIRAANFDFELYASGEYSRLLEQEWGAS